MKNNLLAVNQNTAPAAERKPLSLRPRIHDDVRGFLAGQAQLFDLAEAFGSPLNIMFPQIVAENIAAFRAVYAKHHLGGRIYFTTKPNKSLAVVRQAALEDVGVDVSSEKALQTALSCGFHPARIECTGPKNAAYIALALQQDVTLNADNFDELHQIAALRRRLGKTEKTRLFVRVTGFYSPRLKFTPQDSTFGIHVDEAAAIFAFLEAHRDDFDFQGFSYHFVAMAPEQKAIALENVLELTLAAQKRGLTPKGLNIGGGFEIQYADSREEWLAYVDEIKDSLRHYDGRSLTWNNGGLGFRNEGGVIKGAPAFMDHARPSCGAAEFDALMNTKLAVFGHMSAAQMISDCLLELYIEPGRSLLDQAGITLGQVNFVKPSAHGETLVGLGMNRSNMHSTHQKLLTDPVVIHRDPAACKPCGDGVYYVGNLCLSYDMITYNKTFPDLVPQAGDLVAFINTAAYIMDFVESETLYQKVADKVAVIRDDERFRWFTDAQYRPALL